MTSWIVFGIVIIIALLVLGSRFADARRRIDAGVALLDDQDWKGD